MLSAYLDGELTDAERAAVEAQLEASAEWRAELAEVARRARRGARAARARGARGFWDAVHAHVAADADADDADDDVRRPDHRRAATPSPRGAVGVGRGVRRGRGRGRRGDRACRTAARCARTSPRWSRSTARRDPTTAIPSACSRRSVRSPGSAGDDGVARPATLALCALAAFAVAWPIAASARRERLADAAGGGAPRRTARATPPPTTTSPASRPSRGRRRRANQTAQVRVTDADGAVEIGGADGARSSTRAAAPTCATASGWTGAGGRADGRRPARARPALDARAPPGAARWRGARRRSWSPPARRRRRRRSGWRSTTPPACCSPARCSGPTARCSARCGSRPSTSASATRTRRRRPTGVHEPYRREAHVGARRLPRAERAAGLRARRRVRATPTASLLFYSDGVFTVSVFEQQGDLDWGALPSGGTDSELADTAHAHYREAERRRRWSGSATALVYTCVTDAPSDVFARHGRRARRPTAGARPRAVVDFVLGPFGWG